MAKVMDKFPKIFIKGNGELLKDIEKLSKLVSRDAENSQRVIDIIDILSSAPMEKFANILNREFSKEQRFTIMKALYMLAKECAREGEEKRMESLNRALESLENSLVTVEP